MDLFQELYEFFILMIMLVNEGINNIKYKKFFVLCYNIRDRYFVLFYVVC